MSGEVTPRRRVGRPPLDPNASSPSVKVSLTLAAKAYDQVFAAAQRARVTVPEYLRQQLTRRPIRSVSDPNRA